MDVKIYYNPKTLLESAGTGWIWEVTFLIILIGLTISFVSEVFKIQKKEKPDFFGVVWKTAMIVLLYRYLPDTIEKTMDFVNTAVSSADLDEQFYKVFSIMNATLTQTYSTENFPSGCPATQNVTIMNTGVGYLSAYFFQYFLKVMIFYIMLSIWVAKEIVFSWAWPVFMSLNMIGLCAALVIPAFPNQGFGSIGSFFKSLAAFSLWPVIYSVFIFICEKPLIKVFEITRKSLACPTSYEVGQSTVITISGTVFMALMIVIIPWFSKKIVSHEGVRSAFMSGISSFGTVLAVSGTKISSGTKAGMISEIGSQMVKNGNILSSYAQNAIYKNQNSNNVNIKIRENIKDEKETASSNINNIRDLISSDNSKVKK